MITVTVLHMSAWGSCYCMMESESVSASYTKTGFYFTDDSLTNKPVPVYLHYNQVVTQLVHQDSDDGAGSTATFRWANKYERNRQFDYNVNAITNIVVDHPRDCMIFTLPSSYTETEELYYYEHNTSPGRVEIGECNGKSLYTNGVEASSSGTWYEDVCYTDPPPYTSHSSGSTWIDYVPFDYDLRSIMQNTPWVNLTYVWQIAPNYSFESYEDGYSDNYTVSTHSETYLTTLSNPYTDDMLRDQFIARMPAFTNNWAPGTGYAFYSLGDNHWCGGAGKMQYRVKVPNSETNTIYKIAWYEVTELQNSTNKFFEPRTDIVIGTGNPTNAACGQTIIVDVPDTLSSIYETAPTIIEQTHIGSPPSPPGSMSGF